jgi:predicted SnoaL-like aldol condensation-catalyzing enzyme
MKRSALFEISIRVLGLAEGKTLDELHETVGPGVAMICGRCGLLRRNVAMDGEANKAIARRYFSEMVDKRSEKLLEELWTEDCVVHRPGFTIKGHEAFREAFNRVVGPYSEFKTTIHDLIADNDLVVCHLSHRVVHRGGNWTSRLGSHSVAAGQVVTWPSLTMFRIRDGKIAEEWVCRDELGMLIQLGVVARTT